MTPPAPKPARVSVCMAAYNGAPYIEEQIWSILEQLSSEDELVVVDDASRDDTPVIVSRIHDARIRLVCHKQNRGYVRTFENALQLATGQYLFLADQDDVWLPGRLEAMLSALSEFPLVATSVSVLGDVAQQPRFRLRSEDSAHFKRNILGILVGYRPYSGCAMALRREVLTSALPIPSYVYESHDLWLALVANTHHLVVHLAEPSVARRLHGANQTPLRWRGPISILRARWMLARCLREAISRAGTNDARR